MRQQCKQGFAISQVHVSFNDQPIKKKLFVANHLTHQKAVIMFGSWAHMP